VTAVPLAWYLGLAVVLFGIGLVGVATRRNGVNVAFLAFARARGDTLAHAAVFVVMAVAAAEVAVGLAIAIALFRSGGSVDLDRASRLKG